MNRLTRTLFPAALALSAASSAVFAQTAAPAQPQGRHQQPSAEMIQRFQDGRFAMIKGTLKLTDAQLKLWQPVEDLLRAQQAERAKRMQDRPANRDANAPKPSVAERLELESMAMSTRAANLKALASAVRPLYDSLTEEQKAVAGPLLANLGGGQMHGRRWASRDGGHDGMGHHLGGQQQ